MGGGTTYIGLLKDQNIKAGIAFDGWFFGLLDKEAVTDTKKPFLHIGQEQFLDDKIPGDINDSVDGKRNFSVYQHADKQKSFFFHLPSLSLIHI